MFIILLGSDNFTKKEYVSTLAKQHKADVEFFVSEEQKPNLADFFGQDLFSKTKIICLENLLAGYEYQSGVAAKLAASKNYILFLETKLDKRITGNKQWLADKAGEVKEFILPHGKELDNWLIGRAKQLGGVISLKAADLLAKKLGRDEAKETKAGGKVVAVEEIYNLWQADSEIQKLLAYVREREITEADVNNLVSENIEVDVFALTNAIADGQKQKTMELLSQLFKDQNIADAKSSAIKLNALLSEQFRNIAMVQDFSLRKISEDEILEKTGWKSGRLFVMKKIASRFSAKIIMETLNKLAALDDELKTGSTPPRVLLDLILAQFFV